jgi:hypothetical protein
MHVFCSACIDSRKDPWSSFCASEAAEQKSQLRQQDAQFYHARSQCQAVITTHLSAFKCVPGPIRTCRHSYTAFSSSLDYHRSSFVDLFLSRQFVLNVHLMLSRFLALFTLVLQNVEAERLACCVSSGSAAPQASAFLTLCTPALAW